VNLRYSSLLCVNKGLYYKENVKIFHLQCIYNEAKAINLSYTCISI